MRSIKYVVLKDDSDQAIYVRVLTQPHRQETLSQLLVSPRKCPLRVKNESLIQNVEFLTRHGLLSICLLKSKAKPVWLVCGEQVAVLKDYDLNRHYRTKHADKYKSLTGAEWARATDGLLVKLQTLMISCQLTFA